MKFNLDSRIASRYIAPPCIVVFVVSLYLGLLTFTAPKKLSSNVPEISLKPILGELAAEFPTPQLIESPVTEMSGEASIGASVARPRITRPFIVKRALHKRLARRLAAEKLQKEKARNLAARRTRVFAPVASVKLATPEFTLENLEVSMDAVDTLTPLDKLIEIAFNEPSLSAGIEANRLMSSLQMDSGEVVDREIPRIAPVAEVVMQVKKVADPSIQPTYEKLVAELPKVEADPVVAPSHFERNQLSAPVSSEKTTPLEASENTVPAKEILESSPQNRNVAAVLSQGVAPELNGSVAPKVLASVTSNFAESSKEPVLVRPAPRASEKKIAKRVTTQEVPARVVTQEVPSQIAAPETKMLATQSGALAAANQPSAASEPTLTKNILKPSPIETTRNVESVAKVPAPKTVNEASLTTFSAMGSEVETFTSHGLRMTKGKSQSFEIDPAVSAWIKKHRGHWQLDLEPTRPHQSRQAVDYQYPHTFFKLPSDRPWKGPYRLVARFFSPMIDEPVAQIEFSRLVDEKDVAREFTFSITNEQFVQALKRRRSDLLFVPLQISVFKALEGNRSAPEAIQGASVEITVPHREEMTGVDGVVRFENVPAYSSLILKISKPGFRPTTKIVTTSGVMHYEPVLLVPDSVAKLFTNGFSGQKFDPSEALVFGKVFQSERREIQAGDRIHLADAATKTSYAAKYINTFPTDEAATTSEGLFVAFHLKPSPLIEVERSRGPFSQILGLKAGDAVYEELGAGERKPLFAELINPKNPKALVRGSLRVLGDDRSVVKTNDGTLTLNGIEHDSKVKVLEAEAKGFLTTLHTVPLGKRMKNIRHKIYLVESDYLRNKVQHLDRKVDFSKGTILGSSLWFPPASLNRCLFVQLLDSEGKAVSAEHGPMMLNAPSHQEKESCLRADRPGFAFFGLKTGLYQLVWMGGVHTVYVQEGKVSVHIETP